MDMDPASYLPNLMRAHAFRSKIADSALETNLILNHIEQNLDWFHFGRQPWKKIDQISELDFPAVTFDADQAATYRNLEFNHVYNFSLGTFAIRRALNYLNDISYQNDNFDCQILPVDSAEYERFRNSHFPNQPIRVVRFKVPSYHKSSNFNVGGYRGYLVFIPVISYDSKNKNQLRLKNDYPIAFQNVIDFYFKNCIKSWFCSCKNGARVLSSCAHILAAIIGFGAPQDFSKDKYLPLDPESFRRA